MGDKRTRVWILSFVILALIVGAGIVWQLNCPPLLDDLSFRTMPEAGAADPELVTHRDMTTFGDVMQAIWVRTFYNACRLPNVLATLTALMPEWIPRTAHGVMLGVMMWIIALFVGGRSVMKSPGFCGLMWLTTWITLPFDDGMASSSFYFNYVWPSVMGVVFLLMWNGRIVFKRGWGWMKWVIVAVTALSHEGLSMPLIAGCAAETVLEKKDRRGRCIMIAVMALLAMVALFNPSTVHRIGEASSEQGFVSTIYYIKVLLTTTLSPMLVVAAAVMAIVSRRIMFTVWIRENILLLAAYSGGIFICTFTHYFGRGLWYPSLFALLLLFRTVKTCFPSIMAPHRVTACLAGGFMLFSLVSTTVYQRQYTREFDALMEEAAHCDGTVMYADLSNDREAPWWTFRVPISASRWMFQLWYIGGYHWKEERDVPTVLPTSYRGKAIDEWPRIAGTAGFSGQYPILVRKERLKGDGCVKITCGGVDYKSHPLYVLATLRGGDRYEEESGYNEVPCVIDGDTVWTYHMHQLRKMASNRKIVSIDYEE